MDKINNKQLKIQLQEAVKYKSLTFKAVIKLAFKTQCNNNFKKTSKINF